MQIPAAWSRVFRPIFLILLLSAAFLPALLLPDSIAAQDEAANPPGDSMLSTNKTQSDGTCFNNSADNASAEAAGGQQSASILLWSL